MEERKTQGKPPIPTEALRDFCARHGVRKLYLFGSILTDEFDEHSDVDLMIETDVVHSLRETVAMQEELEALFGRRVDVVTRKAVERSPSKTRRESILSSARVVYAAA